MRYAIKTLLLSLSLVVAAPHAIAGLDDLDELQSKIGKDWVFVKNDQRHGFKTYAKQEDGKRFRSFKAEGVFNASVGSFIRMATDFDNMKKWTWHAIDSKLLKKVQLPNIIFM